MATALVKFECVNSLKHYSFEITSQIRLVNLYTSSDPSSCYSYSLSFYYSLVSYPCLRDTEASHLEFSSLPGNSYPTFITESLWFAELF